MNYSGASQNSSVVDAQILGKRLAKEARKNREQELRLAQIEEVNAAQDEAITAGSGGITQTQADARYHKKGETIAMGATKITGLAAATDATDAANLGNVVAQATYYINLMRASDIRQFAAPTGDVPFNGRKITGLGAPVSLQDAATRSYVDDISNSVLITMSQKQLNWFAPLTTGLSMNGQVLSSLAAPSLSTDAATKGYVDTLASNVWSAQTRMITTIQNNGTLGPDLVVGTSLFGLGTSATNVAVYNPQLAEGETRVYLLTIPDQGFDVYPMIQSKRVTIGNQTDWNQMIIPEAARFFVQLIHEIKNVGTWCPVPYTTNNRTQFLIMISGPIDEGRGDYELVLNWSKLTV